MLILQAIELCDLNRLHPEGGHKSPENLLERILELFPTSNGIFWEAFEPMPSWPFELEG